MQDALLIHRLHFAFTITYHYIFPQLTMGLAPLIAAGYFVFVYRMFRGKVSTRSNSHGY